LRKRLSITPDVLAIYIIGEVPSSAAQIELPSCRASTVALVSKARNDLERSHAVPFRQVTIDASKLNASYINWHLRAPQRLVELNFDASKDLTMELCSLTFGLLSSHARALRVLHLTPPAIGMIEGWSRLQDAEHYLIGLAKLSQLIELKLLSWRYAAEELLRIPHLYGLVNLEVQPSHPPQSCTVMRDTALDVDNPAPIAMTPEQLEGSGLAVVLYMYALKYLGGRRHMMHS